jgi:carbon-monoxide dehydrogenase large subunit
VYQWTRREDERLLTGNGRYVADIEVSGCLEAVFARSKVGHGTLRAVDCSAARATAAMTDGRVFLGLSPPAGFGARAEVCDA